MMSVALLAALIATPAAAHQEVVVHAHPHGIDAVAIGLAAAALGWLVWRLAR